jgi:hypothetical protein
VAGNHVEELPLGRKRNCEGTIKQDLTEVGFEDEYCKKLGQDNVE